MFGLTKEEKAAQEQLTALRAAFGDEAKAEGFDLNKQVSELLALRAGVKKVGSLFGDAANDEDFDLHASVKSLRDENKAVRTALGVEGDASLEDAAKTAAANSETLSKVEQVYGDAAKEDGFKVVDAVQADRDAIETTDGEERTQAEKQKPSVDAKTAKEFRCEADEALDTALEEINGSTNSENQ